MVNIELRVIMFASVYPRTRRRTSLQFFHCSDCISRVASTARHSASQWSVGFIDVCYWTQAANN